MRTFREVSAYAAKANAEQSVGFPEQLSETDFSLPHAVRVRLSSRPKCRHRRTQRVAVLGCARWLREERRELTWHRRLLAASVYIAAVKYDHYLI
ncbi:hypothetical protein EVAR_72530_1 [Eumeta japonica]|uniref:Uncharacterized protein n=1 Tax=Eumeta variegata TaxID=151549 RepID=A0A4C1T1N4_EUMVA|nr:hypothetical protein EVAR_72530_1 [Eumeta japonica]